ncbi:MAG: hypothetical protein ACI4MS_06690 [Candidatus Coproplasma sp.]
MENENNSYSQLEKLISIFKSCEPNLDYTVLDKKLAVATYLEETKEYRTAKYSDLFVFADYNEFETKEQVDKYLTTLDKIFKICCNVVEKREYIDFQIPSDYYLDDKLLLNTTERAKAVLRILESATKATIYTNITNPLALLSCRLNRKPKLKNHRIYVKGNFRTLLLSCFTEQELRENIYYFTEAHYNSLKAQAEEAQLREINESERRYRRKKRIKRFLISIPFILVGIFDALFLTFTLMATRSYDIIAISVAVLFSFIVGIVMAKRIVDGVDDNGGSGLALCIAAQVCAVAIRYIPLSAINRLFISIFVTIPLIRCIIDSEAKNIDFALTLFPVLSFVILHILNVYYPMSFIESRLVWLSFGYMCVYWVAWAITSIFTYFNDNIGELVIHIWSGLINLVIIILIFAFDLSSEAQSVIMTIMTIIYLLIIIIFVVRCVKDDN